MGKKKLRRWVLIRYKCLPQLCILPLCQGYDPPPMVHTAQSKSQEPKIFNPLSKRDGLQHQMPKHSNYSTMCIIAKWCVIKQN